MSYAGVGWGSDILITATDPTNFYVAFHTAVSTEGNVNFRPQSLKGLKSLYFCSAVPRSADTKSHLVSSSDATFVSTTIHQHV